MGGVGKQGGPVEGLDRTTHAISRFRDVAGPGWVIEDRAQLIIAGRLSFFYAEDCSAAHQMGRLYCHIQNFFPFHDRWTRGHEEHILHVDGHHLLETLSPSRERPPSLQLRGNAVMWHQSNRAMPFMYVRTKCFCSKTQIVYFSIFNARVSYTLDPSLCHLHQ